MPPVLAWGFAAPWLLWGLLLAVAPPIIHWLFRRRYRDTPWAAMQFLAAAAKRQTRWQRLDQWLLLAVRMLIPLAAAVALAGPTWQLATGGGPSTAPVQRVLVADASLSLSAVENGRSRLTATKDRALALTGTARPGDAWQLVRMAASPPRAVISHPALQVGPVNEELQNLAPTSEPAEPLAALDTVLSLLGQDRGGFRREVHLLTDGQRSSWRPDDEPQRARLQSLLQAIGAQARIVWEDVSSGPLDNTAVVDLTLDRSYVQVGQPIRATATIRRFGQPPEQPRTLEWRVDGRLVARQAVDLSQEETATQTLPYVPASAGDVRIEAALDPDVLTADDRRGAVCLVRTAVRVLLVDGRPSGVPFENATDALKLALAPAAGATATAGETSGIEPTVISDGELLGTELSRFDVVFLCDVPLLTSRDAEVLKQYVHAGGGLVIAVGPRLNIDSYHAQLYEQGEGLLPARLGEIVGDAAQRETSFGFDGREFSHPILQPFRGNPNTGFELTRTFAFRKAVPVADRATVPLSFDTGDPAIVEGAYGRGRVLLLTTALDRSWGTWAVWGHTFVPMMHETVRYLVAFRSRERTLLVRQPVRFRLEARLAGTTWSVRLPSDERVPLPPPSDAAAGLLYEDTAEPGFYGIEAPGSANGTAWFAVNVDPRESDLRPLSATELRDGLFGGKEYDTDADRAEIAEDAALLADDAAGLSRWLLGVVLLFLVCEPFLAWNRLLSAGVALGLAGCALAGWLAGPWGAIAAAAIGALVVAGMWYRPVLAPRQ
uniref:VWA domain-containing protein n=1 Tax=Schlesneria paludicola TaxID=360056 RepID=A0A7C2K2V7_9PLAN